MFTSHDIKLTAILSVLGGTAIGLISPALGDYYGWTVAMPFVPALAGIIFAKGENNHHEGGTVKYNLFRSDAVRYSGSKSIFYTSWISSTIIAYIVLLLPCSLVALTISQAFK